MSKHRAKTGKSQWIMAPQGPELCPWWLGGFMRRMFPLRVCDWPGPGAARLPVLILGLSLDPKPKVVRPKTKINFTKKVKCYSIPTLTMGRIEKTSDFTQDRFQDPAPRKFGSKAPKKARVKNGPVGRGDDGHGWTRVPDFSKP